MKTSIRISQMKLTARLSEWLTDEIEDAKQWTKEHYENYRVIKNRSHQTVEIYGYNKK